ncbi:hypothetical protein CDAR_18001 [Caerostris darwini]|uniref:Uncharacterized protein n=1 Tax=Caerostris darwini TaxID=1538125 RepID=A0AAV4PLD3_9ARAC|nr:hypothetical protein CDAR_18001 [Caerostris darwini]
MSICKVSHDRICLGKSTKYLSVLKTIFTKVMIELLSGVGGGERNTRKKDISLCWWIGCEEVYKRLLDADLAEHISPSYPTASALKNVSTSEIHHEHQSIVPLFGLVSALHSRDGREVPSFSSGQKEDNEGSVAHKARFEEEEVVGGPPPSSHHGRVSTTSYTH